jgi:hypothetical protein
VVKRNLPVKPAMLEWRLPGLARLKEVKKRVNALKGGSLRAPEAGVSQRV